MGQNTPDIVHFEPVSRDTLDRPAPRGPWYSGRPEVRVDSFFKLDDVWVSRPQPQGGAKDLLAGVSLDVPRGARWAVVGSSGAGKSTLLRLFNRMVEPSRGRVLVEGEPLDTLHPAALRCRVALVFQEPAWLPGTARDNLFAASALGLLSREKAESRLARILTLAGIQPEHLPRVEDELSVGQRQRVMLGRALMGEPRALLLDEPTAALDPPSARELLDQVVRLNEADGLTMVLVTHRLEDARRFGTHTMVLDGGKVKDMGLTAEVLPRLQKTWETA
jgi:ABC-type methionine transport system ATPase subunit